MTERESHIDHLQESDIPFHNIRNGIRIRKTYGGHHGVEIVGVVAVGGSHLRSKEEEASLPWNETVGHLHALSSRVGVEEDNRSRIHNEEHPVDRPGEFLRRNHCTVGRRMVEDSSSRGLRAARSGKRGSSDGHGTP